ncbi:MAG: extracellular solute-binding protein [Clostridiales bacterium]|nr:extracellular solute-binding protein [Clostridiales bacterium]
MKILKRFVSCLLATIVVASTCMSVSSCKKKGADKKKVLETDSWYTTKRIELDPHFTSDDYIYVDPQGPYLLCDRYVMRYHVASAPNEDVKHSVYHDLMGIFDLEGKLLGIVNLSEIIKEFESAYAPSMYLGLVAGEKGIRLYFEVVVSEKEWNPDDPSAGANYVTQTKVYCTELDPNTGEVIEPGHPSDLRPVDSKDFWVYDVKSIEGYDVCNAWSHDKEQSILFVGKNDKALYDVDFEQAFGPGVYNVVNTYGYGNGQAIVEVMGKTQLIAQLDLASGKVTQVKDGKPMSRGQNYSSTNEGIGYLTKATGIYEYDVTGKNETCKLNFDYCDVNRFEAQNATVLAVEGDKVVLGSLPPFEGYIMPEPAIVYVLEKAEKNPNAGKTILTVASISDSISHFEAQAMTAFNEQNPEYHVQLVLYDQREYQSAGEVTDDIDTTDRQMYSALSMVSGSLTMDIRSGNGPDVILGAAQSIDVLDSQYLEDLSPYLQRETYDASAYYSKIIEASRLDGKLYFIPTAFTIGGIVMDGSRVAPDQVGFTYEQYASFVENEFNGVDLVTGYISRMHFLNLCFERSYDQWLKDKKMNLDTEDFRVMAAFFKDKIPEGVSAAPANQYDEIIPTIDEETIYDFIYVENIDSIRTLAQINYFDKNLKILGLPSENGTGPSASITNSFSITAGSAVKEGAYAFLDILLSENVMKLSNMAFPINRAATAYRVDIMRQGNQTSYDELQQPGQLRSDMIYRCASIYDPRTKLDEILLQTFEAVDTVLMSDNAVMMIVDEELPAYLLGQKDLDTVISTINNRAQNVFNER